MQPDNREAPIISKRILCSIDILPDNLVTRGARRHPVRRRHHTQLRKRLWNLCDYPGDLTSRKSPTFYFRSRQSRREFFHSHKIFLNNVSNEKTNKKSMKIRFFHYYNRLISSKRLKRTSSSRKYRIGFIYGGYLLSLRRNQLPRRLRQIQQRKCINL